MAGIRRLFTIDGVVVNGAITINSIYRYKPLKMFVVVETSSKFDKYPL